MRDFVWSIHNHIGHETAGFDIFAIPSLNAYHFLFSHMSFLICVTSIIWEPIKDSHHQIRIKSTLSSYDFWTNEWMNEWTNEWMTEWKNIDMHFLMTLWHHFFFFKVYGCLSHTRYLIISLWQIRQGWRCYYTPRLAHFVWIFLPIHMQIKHLNN